MMKDMTGVLLSIFLRWQGSKERQDYRQRHQRGRAFADEGVALECAGEQWPVRVFRSSGVIATPIWDKIDPTMMEDSANNLDPDEMSKSLVPVRVAGQPLDTQTACCF